MNTILVLLACALHSLHTSHGYHILCVFPVGSRSHNALGKGFVDALLKAGHQVSWATPFPPKNTAEKLNIIDLSVTRAVSDAIDMTDMRNTNAGISFVKQFSRNISRAAISAPAFRDALVKEKFDAVVTEAFFSDSDAGYAALLQVPWILFSGVVMQPNLETQVDEVRTVSTIPVLFNKAPIPMSFWNRVVNTLICGMLTIDSWIDHTSTASLYESHFAPLASARGVPLPAFTDAFYNVSVLFLNSHPSFAPATSLPPNVIDIAGFHIDDNPPPLPKDLQELLDASPQGVVYFSMGSVLKSANFPAHTRKALIRVLGELPHTVLWKFEEQLDGLPKNVHIRPWMPQASILAHPNVKLFITHGGLLSTLESLHYGVPQLAIPVFGDQPANADRSERAGFALSVPFDPDMTEDVNTALKELLGNDSYYKKAKYLSKLFRSRPVAPSKLITHYIELAIETKGAYHLRSISLLYPWYQRWMLDQAAAALLVLFVICAALKAACGLCSSRDKTATSKSGKKNKVKKN